MLINLIGPNIVKKTSDVFLLNIVTFAPAILGALLASLCICNSNPPVAPSKSAAEASLPFFSGIKKLFTSKTFWVLFLGIGSGLGITNALFAVMQQVLCVKGYSNSFAGYCNVLIIAGGLVGAIITGIAADKTKKFEQIAKVAISIGMLLVISFTLIVEYYRNMKAPLGVVCFLIGMAVTGFVAVGFEMSAECTYPVATTTALGFVSLSATAQGMVFIAIMQALARPIFPTDLDYLYQVCTKPGDNSAKSSNQAVNNMSIPLLVFSGIGTVMSCAFTVLLKPRYKRMELEAEMNAEGRKRYGSMDGLL